MNEFKRHLIYACAVVVGFAILNATMHARPAPIAGTGSMEILTDEDVGIATAAKQIASLPVTPEKEKATAEGLESYRPQEDRLTRLESEVSRLKSRFDRYENERLSKQTSTRTATSGHGSTGGSSGTATSLDYSALQSTVVHSVPQVTYQQVCDGTTCRTVAVPNNAQYRSGNPVSSSRPVLRLLRR